MGILLGSNFTVNTGLPLDDRTVVLDNTVRDALVPTRRYVGLKIFTTSTNKEWQLQGGILNVNWVEITGGGAGAAYVGTSGFSTRFNEAVDASTLQLAVDNILKFGYVAPQVSLAAAGSGVISEKGQVISAANLTATTVKTARNIQRVEFFRGATSISVNDPASSPNGGTLMFNDATPFSDNVTYTAAVTDIAGVPAATTVTSTPQTYQFVYPYYFGPGAVGLTPAQVRSTLALDIRLSTATLAKTFVASAGQVLYFAQPAAYPALTSILDGSGFESLPDFTVATVNITGLDATVQSYRVYQFNNPLSAGTYTYTFKR